MKTMMILILMCATACAVESPRSATAVDEQELNCGDNCDPGNFQALMSEMVNSAPSGTSAFGPVYCRVVHGYDDVGIIESWSECTNYYQDSSNRYMVDCANRSGAATCASLSCGSPSQPTC